MRPRPRGYAATTYDSPYWIVRYPHRARFSAAVREIHGARGKRILDYGAGDGHLFVTMADDSIEGVAYEPVPRFMELFQEHAASLNGQVSLTGDIADISGQFDVIVCMSVLEHMPLPERQRFYDLCDRHLAPGGSIVIEVPIEGGVTVLVKELGRMVLKRRKPEFGLRTFIAAALGRMYFDPARFDPTSDETWIMWHAGFDYRLLHAELDRRFQVIKRYPTPLPWLPALLGNQEMFFVLKRRDKQPSNAALTPLG